MLSQVQNKTLEYKKKPDNESQYHLNRTLYLSLLVAFGHIRTSVFKKFINEKTNSSCSTSHSLHRTKTKRNLVRYRGFNF